VSAEEKTREKGVTISLLGREFRVGCPEGEEKQLQASVDYLNRKLKEVRDTGKVVGNERIAIMAALNIAHEFVSNDGKGNSGGGAEVASIRRRILAMQETLDTALAADQENLF
jgi:cell division protein ZapA